VTRQKQCGHTRTRSPRGHANAGEARWWWSARKGPSRLHIRRMQRRQARERSPSCLSEVRGECREFDEHVQRREEAQKAIDADFHPSRDVVGAPLPNSGRKALNPFVGSSSRACYTGQGHFRSPVHASIPAHTVARIAAAGSTRHKRREELRRNVPSHRSRKRRSGWSSERPPLARSSPFPVRAQAERSRLAIAPGSSGRNTRPRRHRPLGRSHSHS